MASERPKRPRTLTADQRALFGFVLLFLGFALKYLTTGCHFPTIPDTTGVDPAGPLIVAVAANFAPTLEKLADVYEAKTGQAVTLSVGSSGALQRQAREGAPFDLFLSADNVRIEELARENVIVPESVAVYAQGRLVLWWRPTPARPVVDDRNHASYDSWKRVHDWARDESFRVAMANPVHAPYGVAAERAMNREIVRIPTGQLVVMEDVRQAWRVAKSGNVDAAFVPLSFVLDDKEGAWEELHASHYLYQSMGRLLYAPHPEEAEKFRQFLLSPEAQAIIIESGYGGSVDFDAPDSEDQDSEDEDAAAGDEVVSD